MTLITLPFLIIFFSHSYFIFLVFISAQTTKSGVSFCNRGGSRCLFQQKVHTGSKKIMNNGVFILTRGGGRNGTSGLNGRVFDPFGHFAGFFFTRQKCEKKEKGKKIGHRKLALEPRFDFGIAYYISQRYPRLRTFFWFWFFYGYEK
ncbi:hypothetical protein V8C40DRAFT_112980 [Trichoderma camerunense]